MPPSKPRSKASLTIAEQIRSHRNALTAEQLADYLSCSVKNIYKQAKKSMPHMKIGSLVRFDPGVTADWVEARAI